MAFFIAGGEEFDDEYNDDVDNCVVNSQVDLSNEQLCGESPSTRECESILDYDSECCLTNGGSLMSGTLSIDECRRILASKIDSGVSDSHQVTTCILSVVIPYIY